MLRILLGLVFAGATVFVALNAHMDFLPCVRKDVNFTTGQIERKETTCSLLYIYNQEHMQGEGGELTPAGWGTAAGALVLLPFAVGFWIGGLLSRRR